MSSTTKKFKFTIWPKGGSPFVVVIESTSQSDAEKAARPNTQTQVLSLALGKSARATTLVSSLDRRFGSPQSSGPTLWT